MSCAVRVAPDQPFQSRSLVRNFFFRSLVTGRFRLFTSSMVLTCPCDLSGKIFNFEPNQIKFTPAARGFAKELIQIQIGQHTMANKTLMCTGRRGQELCCRCNIRKIAWSRWRTGQLLTILRGCAAFSGSNMAAYGIRPIFA